MQAMIKGNHPAPYAMMLSQFQHVLFWLWPLRWMLQTPTPLHYGPDADNIFKGNHPVPSAATLAQLQPSIFGLWPLWWMLQSLISEVSSCAMDVVASLTLGEYHNLYGEFFGSAFKFSFSFAGFLWFFFLFGFKMHLCLIGVSSVSSRV